MGPKSSKGIPTFVHDVPLDCNSKNAMILIVNCIHFGLCGGCRCVTDEKGTHPLPYDQELTQKETRVRDLLSSYEVGEWHPILPSPEEWHYRNKMECAFAVWDDRLVLGLRAQGRFDRVINVETCG